MLAKSFSHKINKFGSQKSPRSNSDRSYHENQDDKAPSTEFICCDPCDTSDEYDTSICGCFAPNIWSRSNSESTETQEPKEATHPTHLHVNDENSNSNHTMGWSVLTAQHTEDDDRGNHDHNKSKYHTEGRLSKSSTDDNLPSTSRKLNDDMDAVIELILEKHNLLPNVDYSPLLIDELHESYERCRLSRMIKFKGFVSSQVSSDMSRLYKLEARVCEYQTEVANKNEMIESLECELVQASNWFIENKLEFTMRIAMSDASISTLRSQLGEACSNIASLESDNFQLIEDIYSYKELVASVQLELNGLRATQEVGKVELLDRLNFVSHRSEDLELQIQQLRVLLLKDSIRRDDVSNKSIVSGDFVKDEYKSYEIENSESERTDMKLALIASLKCEINDLRNVLSWSEGRALNVERLLLARDAEYADKVESSAVSGVDERDSTIQQLSNSFNELSCRHRFLLEETNCHMQAALQQVMVSREMETNDMQTEITHLLSQIKTKDLELSVAVARCQNTSDMLSHTTELLQASIFDVAEYKLTIKSNNDMISVLRRDVSQLTNRNIAYLPVRKLRLSKRLEYFDPTASAKRLRSKKDILSEHYSPIESQNHPLVSSSMSNDTIDLALPTISTLPSPSMSMSFYIPAEIIDGPFSERLYKEMEYLSTKDHDDATPFIKSNLLSVDDTSILVESVHGPFPYPLDSFQHPDNTQAEDVISLTTTPPAVSPVSPSSSGLTEIETPLTPEVVMTRVKKQQDTSTWIQV